MRTRQFDAQSPLIGLVAVLGVTAMLAGPASAQEVVEARTGDLHEDCGTFSLEREYMRVHLHAWCRVSDTTSDTAKTSMVLNRTIAVMDSGQLYFRAGGSYFHHVCRHEQVSELADGVEFKAECKVKNPPNQHEAWQWSTLDLNDSFRVNSRGQLEIR